MSKVFFLSSPYSQSKKIEKERYLKAVAFVAQRMNLGEFILSPIVHCHEVAVRHKLPTSWEYWRDYCVAMISRCDAVYVLMLDGFETSNGVRDEIQIARELNKEIIYINEDGIIFDPVSI